MKWEEIIAEAREAGVLAFCAEGIAVLKQVQPHAAKEEAEPDKRIPGQDRQEGRSGGDGKSKG